MQVLDLQAQQATRFESDRETLPFPTGGVFCRPIQTDQQNHPTPNPTDDPIDFANSILTTIDHMKSSLDTLEHELGAELERELNDIGGVVARIGAQDDWPPTAA